MGELQCTVRVCWACQNATHGVSSKGALGAFQHAQHSVQARRKANRLCLQRSSHETLLLWTQAPAARRNSKQWGLATVTCSSAEVLHTPHPMVVAQRTERVTLCAVCALLPTPPGIRFPPSRPMPVSATITDWVGWLDFTSLEGMRKCLKINNRTGECVRLWSPPSSPQSPTSRGTRQACAEAGSGVWAWAGIASSWPWLCLSQHRTLNTTCSSILHRQCACADPCMLCRAHPCLLYRADPACCAVLHTPHHTQARCRPCARCRSPTAASTWSPASGACRAASTSPARCPTRTRQPPFATCLPTSSGQVGCRQCMGSQCPWSAAQVCSVCLPTSAGQVRRDQE